METKNIEYSPLMEDWCTSCVNGGEPEDNKTIIVITTILLFIALLFLI